MSMRKSFAALLVALGAGAGVALAESPNLGRSVSEADLQQWDIAILPNGTGLPPGQGTPQEGEGRGDATRVWCAPLLDGVPVGARTRLAGRPATSIGGGFGAYNPRTGQIDHPSPGDVPDVFWFRFDQTARTTAGTHQFAMSCQGPESFSFRGEGTLMVLQAEPRRQR